MSKPVAIVEHKTAGASIYTIEGVAPSAYAELQRLAESATPGRWMRLFGERTVYDRMEDGCRGNAIVRADITFNQQDAANLDYIAAANPAVILELIAALAAPAKQEAAPLAAAPEAARDVLAERQRQKDVEGWTPKLDDDYQQDELQRAAMCYLMRPVREAALPHALWPWNATWWKPTTERRNLVKAGALILAEIERLDRASDKASRHAAAEAWLK